jgi:hypothetical protein
MQESSICGHPQHLHSFHQVHFSFFSPLRKCAGCQVRLQAVVLFGGSNDASQHVLRCIACGAVAHRSCALSNRSMWTEMCPVNARRVLSVPASSDVEGFIDGDVLHSGERHLCSSPSLEDETIEFISDQLGVDTSRTDDSVFSPRHSASQSTPLVATSVGETGAAELYPLHHTSQPFTSVSRALQENIIAHFQRTGGSSNDNNLPQDNNNEQAAKEDLSFMKFASETFQAAKTSVQMPGRAGTAAVAGGIAGGVVGLVMAGPAGAYAGCKLGQAAGVLGVIAEGSVTIGVFVASVATASITAQQIQAQLQERHVLTMGEAGTSRKVLLVRPNIQIDPVWEDIAADARSSAPKQHLANVFGLLSIPLTAGSRERYRRDNDILKTAEDEIPTEQKVLLLVSRILSDKSSLPGCIYRELIESFRNRCDERELISSSQDDDSFRRARRDDAHAVIKHVTAALLELRPVFATSPEVTELTATAVEGLVFGQLYDSVWVEIVAETAVHDASLIEKIRAFRQELLIRDYSGDATTILNTRVSEAALDALRMFPQYHSPVDKLHYCVRFLECISDYFSSCSVSICAESLLKMVCQHIIVFLSQETNDSAPRNIHAQVAFLEEFARDEHLLRGREGYSLVTLQAALHFLGMSDDLELDIFDNDEENGSCEIDVATIATEEKAC